jgi:aspartate aminotransferase
MAAMAAPNETGTAALGPRRVSVRVGAVSPSATLAVDAKAKQLRAQGEDVVGFGAGEPDFPTPDHIVEAAIAACRIPSNHHYSPTGGLPELKRAIAEATRAASGLDVPPSQVLVTNGAKQAVYEAFAAIVDPGDEVLVPAPYWTTYPEAVALAGGVAVPVPCSEESGFHLQVDALEAALTPATKVLLFVSPNNPTGAVSTREEVEAVGAWADAHGLWVVCDEIYEHLVYGGRRAHSLPVLTPSLAERAVVVNGVAKTYAMTGWRVGWLIGPPDVVEAATNLQSHMTSNVANVSQHAALAALRGGLDAVASMREVFDRRRVTMHRMLNECAGVHCMEPEGAFYAFPSVTGLLGRRVAGRAVASSLDVAELAVDEARVAVVPGEAFGAPGFLRLSYALGDEDLVEGISRLDKLFATVE